MVTFRDANIADLPSIVDIYNSTISSRMVTADTEPVSVESRVTWFEEHSADFRPIWVAEDEGIICGWISFEPFKTRAAYDQTAEVSIYIKSGLRGKGLGSKMLQEVVDRCQSLNIRTLLGYIFGHNEPSLNLFKKFGFEEWAVLPNIAELDGVERDLVILGKRVR